MRKALKKVAILATTTLILATLLVVSVFTTSASTTSTKDYVFEYLTEEMGLNSAAACGIMANIESESKFSSTSVIVDTNGLLSGGLCQWNGSRFTKLISYCESKGLDYLSVEGQLSYLQYELENGYSSIYSYLKSVPDTADGAYAAGYYWCYYFEIPANRSSKSVTRGNSAKNSYWTVYGNTSVSNPDLELNGEIFDVDDIVEITYSSVESYADVYNLYITTVDENGECNWNMALVLTSSEGSTESFTDLVVGDYACYVQAGYTTKDIYSDDDNIVYFTVECQSHEFRSTVIEEATLASTGIREYCCLTCDETYTKEIAQLELSDLDIEIQDDVVPVSMTKTVDVTNDYAANTIFTTGDASDFTALDAIFPTNKNETSSRRNKSEKNTKFKVTSI